MICGIDEAGRGCIGGSLFVCGICYEEEFIPSLKFLEIQDSKKLSKAQRKFIAQNLIVDPNISYALVKKTASEIDHRGISQCIREALEEIMQSLKGVNQFIYDGNCTFKAKAPPYTSLRTQIKGDSLIHQISSASIIAKYAKDQECIEIHNLYPSYGFLSHSGYCTSLHREKIMQFGYTPYHRKSFKLKP